MTRAVAGRNVHGDHGAHPSRLHDADIVGDVWIGKDVNLGKGAKLDRVILGDGAKVPANATLERVVVWDGAEVPDRPLRDAIVTNETIVELSR